jgi:hypothetical protein
VRGGGGNVGVLSDLADDDSDTISRPSGVESIGLSQKNFEPA